MYLECVMFVYYYLSLYTELVLGRLMGSYVP